MTNDVDKTVHAAMYADKVRVQSLTYDGASEYWLTITDVMGAFQLTCLSGAEVEQLRDVLLEVAPLPYNWPLATTPQEPAAPKKKAPKGPQAYKGNGKHKWEHVVDITDRLRVPGGWLYNDGNNTVFVPCPDVVGYSI